MHELIVNIWRDPFRYTLGAIMVLMAIRLVFDFIDFS